MNFQFETLRGGSGQPLLPHNAYSDLLFTHDLDRCDAELSSSLIFVHREKINRAQPLELRWDKMKFRVGLLEWIDSLSARSSGVTDSAS